MCEGGCGGHGQRGLFCNKCADEDDDDDDGDDDADTRNRFCLPLTPELERFYAQKSKMRTFQSFGGNPSLQLMCSKCHDMGNAGKEHSYCRGTFVRDADNVVVKAYCIECGGFGTIGANCKGGKCRTNGVGNKFVGKIRGNFNFNFPVGGGVKGGQGGDEKMEEEGEEEEEDGDKLVEEAGGAAGYVTKFSSSSFSSSTKGKRGASHMSIDSDDDSEDFEGAKETLGKKKQKKQPALKWMISEYPHFVSSLSKIANNKVFLHKLCELLLSPGGEEVKVPVVVEPERRAQLLRFSGWDKETLRAKRDYLQDKDVFKKNADLVDVAKVLGVRKGGTRPELVDEIIAFLKRPSVVKKNPDGAHISDKSTIAELGIQLSTGGEGGAAVAEADDFDIYKSDMLVSKFFAHGGAGGVAVGGTDDYGFDLYKSDMWVSKVFAAASQDLNDTGKNRKIKRKWDKLESPVKRRYARAEKSKEKKEARRAAKGHEH